VDCQFPEISESSRTYSVAPLVGSPVAVAETVFPVATPSVRTPRFCEPAPVDPSHSWYSATPLPADHVNVSEEPGNTLPGAGLIIAPGALACASAMPVPLRLTTGLPEVELLLSVRLPVAAPTDVGVNCKLTAYVPPEAIVTGMLLCPITEKGPVTLTWEICTAAVLSFFTETDAPAVCPN
jgi:hypothetical protein